MRGTAVKRIRTPHPHDVLSGRGGGINSHDGNVQFRSWVHERKNDYNLASNKAEKARVAREVIALVQGQNPPGRFLQKDPSSIGGQTWWVELDDEKMMAKTSQALREGAPQIRAAHKEEMEEIRVKRINQRRAPKRTMATRYVEPETPALLNGKPNVVAQLQANMEAARDADDNLRDERPNKRVRVEYNGQTLHPNDVTPPLMPAAAPAAQIEPLSLSRSLNIAPPTVGKGLSRAHSLALSDISFGDLEDEFVNPFENETGFESNSSMSSAPRPGVVRDSSLASDSVGGYGAIRFKEPSTPTSNGVRTLPKTLNASTSSRYVPDYWRLDGDAVPLLV